MNTTTLKNFAQKMRRRLMEAVSSRITYVLTQDTPALREKADQVDFIRRKTENEEAKNTFIEKVAYIWFNRFMALRFMDANDFTAPRVMMPLEGQFHPQILEEALDGVFPDYANSVIQKVQDYLNGTIPATNPQNEAYRQLVVAACNHYHESMRFIFEVIDDYTTLLMPADIISPSSIPAAFRELPNEDLKKVESIGWMYQFYISEKKDEVMAAKKAYKKEDIPAATQLFTPNWIVRYMVENSLGRLWMLNNPDSVLVDKMEYYIKPEETEEDYLKVSSPEDIKLCDPACGSGHILVYAFDLILEIYREEMYPEQEIPSLILKNNLFGLELDPRASQLASFALMMKARSVDSRFLNKGIVPNILLLEPVDFEDGELEEYMKNVNSDLFTQNLLKLLYQFKDADNFGSLIKPVIPDLTGIKEALSQYDFEGDLLLYGTHQKVMRVLKYSEYLNPRYHCVVANPPYMGGKGMNPELKKFAKDNYPDSKSDLFAMFIERNLDLLLDSGYTGMITMQSWMFLSSYEKLRKKLLNTKTISSMAHLGARGFDSIGGEVVQTTAFVIQNKANPSYNGAFFRLIDGKNEAEKSKMYKLSLPTIHSPLTTGAKRLFFHSSSSDFKKIPGSPIAYSASLAILNLFSHNSLGKIANTRLGMATADNNLFLRLWAEVSLTKACLIAETRSNAVSSGGKWFPYQKGGDYRKWYGNLEYYVNWEDDGYSIQNFRDEKTGKVRSHNYNLDFIFKKGVTWNALTSGKTSARISTNSLFDNSGSSLFLKSGSIEKVMGLINSNVMLAVFPLISPTLNYQPGDMAKLPFFFPEEINDPLGRVVNRLIELAKNDWNSYETSWEFSDLPLLRGDSHQDTLEETYCELRRSWKETTLEMQRLEQENNRIFIDAYGLQDELTPEVPLNEITLTCNPWYRYGKKVDSAQFAVDGFPEDPDIEKRLLTDTMKEFISYAVGCIFGRYSLNKPGLILANQGEAIEDYYEKVEKSPDEVRFKPDENNVLPILDTEWFEDDIVSRFGEFLKVTFGAANYAENLSFIEQAIGKDIRKYFVNDFYKDHVQRYKKRPIYWLFSSPKDNFQALIYLHRYRPETPAAILDYVRDLHNKLESRIPELSRQRSDTSASKAEQREAEKTLNIINSALPELEAYDRDILHPLALKRLEIDLDDGVKVNYAKFGTALKKVKGLS